MFSDRLITKGLQGRCDHGEVLTATCDECRTAAEQPALDTKGEWRVGQSDSLMDRRRIYEEDRIVAIANSERDAAQIVADHGAAKSQALLVEAAGAALSLLRNIGTGKWANTPAGDKLRAALKAAGVEK
jgi:hypothetical protein